MEINADLLSKILTGDSSGKVNVLKWHIENNAIPGGTDRLSELSRLTVEYQRKGKTFEKSFILKVPSTHPMYNIGLQWSLYEKEYPIYVEVLEEMYKLDGEHLGAKLYYTDDKYSLMMKDLQASGYKMADPTRQLDFHQCYATLKSLAKFHALSVKLNQSSKISHAIKRIPWLDNFELREQLKIHLSYCCEVLTKYLDANLGVNEKLLRIKDSLGDKVYQEVDSHRYKFKVLIHGDGWMGTRLFKNDKYGNVAKVKLIDFQTSSWLSPAFDILGFVISSMRFDVFEKHFDILMETYVETLNNTMEFYQCGSYYSMEELRRDMENLPGTVIQILCSNLPQILSNHTNSLDYHRCIKKRQMNGGYLEKIFENEIYLNVASNWISYYDKKDSFDWEI